MFLQSQYTRPDPPRSYDYNGFYPYGAAELHSLDACVENDFSGNVPEELIRTGAAFWDESFCGLKIGKFWIKFVEMEG